MYFYVSHTNTLDMGLTLFLFVALGAFILAQRDGTTARDNRLWMHVVWAAMALAVLTKGLIGIVLPAISMVLYTLLERDWRLWTRLHIASGSLLFLAIVNSNDGVKLPSAMARPSAWPGAGTPSSAATVGATSIDRASRASAPAFTPAPASTSGMVETSGSSPPWPPGATWP